MSVRPSALLSQPRTTPLEPRVLRILRGRAGVLFVIVPLALVEVVVDGWMTLSYKYIVDKAIEPADGRWLAILLASLGIGVVVASIVSVYREHLIARTVTSVVNDVRVAAFDQCQRLSIGFYARTQVSEIVGRFATDIASLEAWASSAVATVLMPGLSVVVGASLLFLVLEWHLALIGVLVWPLVLIGPRIIAPRAAKAVDQKRTREAQMLVTVEESIQAHKIIKAYGLVGMTQSLFRGKLDTFARDAVRSGFLSSLVERSTVISIYTVQVIVIAIGSFMAYRRQVSVGSLISFLTLFWNLGWSVVVIGRSAPALVGAAASIRRVDELLNEAPDPVEATGTALAPLEESLDFDDVTFGYTTQAPVLRGLTLTIRKGQSVAFVGPSGSGKSTVFNVLARFYDPQYGTISIDGVNVKTATAASLRSQMGIVLQDSFLFNTTLRENIRLGKLGATDAEVEHAAKLAEIHDLILAMPEQYETLAGERGSRLSGGQRQRIALARALIRDPSILLLDEASSALDPATEVAINEMLTRASKGRTTIAITHRLATAMNADCIFVIDGGKLKEQGSHRELVKRDGVYADLWRKQNGFVVSDDGHSAEVTGERLRSIPLLTPLSDAQLASLATRFVCERATPGHTVIREGDVGSLFYMVARGSVSVTRRGEGGEPHEVARLADGDQFGEMALLYDMPRSATVTTTTDCLFLTLTRHHFLDLIGTTPDLRENVEKVAQARILRG